MGTQNAKGVLRTLSLVIAVAFLFAGFYVSQHLHTKKAIDESVFHGTYLKTPRMVKPFRLMGIDNQVFDNERLKGHWTFVFFGFTQCGTICPTTMAKLSKMYQILEVSKVKPLPKVVLISIDSKRDSLSKISHYVTSFNPNFYGARGEDETILPLTREMGIAYEKVVNQDNPNSEAYNMEHSGTLILFNPQGEISAFFTMPHNADWLAKDYMLLV